MRLKTLLLLTAVLTTPCSLAFASNIPLNQVTGIVAFGDSLSDNGNASIATFGAFPGPGYATKTVPGVPFPVGYFTNPQFAGGPTGVWVDQLAALLGLPDPAPALGPLGGTNFAIGSALTGNANPQDMANQIALFLASTGGTAPSSALYTFWGGANDVLDALNPVAAADNVAAEIAAVAAAGGKYFLWLNLPDLGNIPAFAGNPATAAAANASSQAFDLEWASRLGNLQALGINVVGVDVETLFNAIQANPSNYGLNNVTTPCAITPGCNPNTALFWDAEHPTTEGHELVADLAYTAITPEPSTWMLVSTSVIGLAGALRRRTSHRLSHSSSV
jgi:phospholipase/lecithinase/hemolysin